MRRKDHLSDLGSPMSTPLYNTRTQPFSPFEAASPSHRSMFPPSSNTASYLLSHQAKDDENLKEVVIEELVQAKEVLIQEHERITNVCFGLQALLDKTTTSLKSKSDELDHVKRSLIVMEEKNKLSDDEKNKMLEIITEKDNIIAGQKKKEESWKKTEELNQENWRKERDAMQENWRQREEEWRKKELEYEEQINKMKDSQSESQRKSTALAQQLSALVLNKDNWLEELNQLDNIVEKMAKQTSSTS